jgi:hypothetical protein
MMMRVNDDDIGATIGDLTKFSSAGLFLLLPDFGKFRQKRSKDRPADAPSDPG